MPLLSVPLGDAGSGALLDPNVSESGSDFQAANIPSQPQSRPETLAAPAGSQHAWPWRLRGRCGSAGASWTCSCPACFLIFGSRGSLARRAAGRRSGGKALGTGRDAVCSQPGDAPSAAASQPARADGLGPAALARRKECKRFHFFFIFIFHF